MGNILVVAFLLAFAFPSLASLYGVGQKPPNYCWKDANDKTICLDDEAIDGRVRVLLYNAGWCGPCKNEFSSVAKDTASLKGKAVTFISLSAAGWRSASPPDRTFLGEWRSKFGLDKAAASFVVAASPRDAGNDFFASPAIPNVVVIGMDGKVAYKAINPGVNKIVQEVRKLLPKTVPRPVP